MQGAGLCWTECGSEPSITLRSERSTLNHQPTTHNPEPTTHNPQPKTLNSQRTTRTPQSLTLNPQPSILNPQPSTLNSQPTSLNPQPSNLNPPPPTLNPQPATQGREHSHRKSSVPAGNAHGCCCSPVELPRHHQPSERDQIVFFNCLDLYHEERQCKCRTSKNVLIPL